MRLQFHLETYGNKKTSDILMQVTYSKVKKKTFKIKYRVFQKDLNDLNLVYFTY
jgi:hypothetical protein